MEDKKNIKRPRGKVRLLEGKCIACGARCQMVCPADAIEMDEKGEPIIDIKKCTTCMKCVKTCPASALERFYTPEEEKILEEIKKQKGSILQEAVIEEVDSKELELKQMLEKYKGVWVYIEHQEGQVAKVSWELIGTASDLAKELNVEISAIIIGHKIEHLCQEAFSYGANNAYIIDDPVFQYYRTKPYLKALCYLTRKYKPEIVLMGATGLGRDLAGAVATELQAGLTADCTGLSIDENRNLLQTRPAFGGNIMATIICDRTRPQMATVRPHVMPLPSYIHDKTGKIIREDIELEKSDLITKIVEIISNKDAKDVDIAGAEFIISGGRGMLAKENFAILEELANELGGVVGSSRSAVDAGWMPYERQVGQTGKTVRPKIYIACGISGAIQHLVGMQNSDIIIAINRDKDAPIFEVATYGIVGDLFEVVPALTKQIRAIKEKKNAVKI